MLSLQTDEAMTASKPVAIKCSDWCNAKSRVVKYSVTWSLTGRFKTGCDAVDPIRSPAFRLGPKDELEARLVIYPRGDPSALSDDFSSLYMQITSSYDEAIIARLVLTVSNIASYTKDMFLTRETFTPGLGWGFREMYPRSEVWSESTHTVTCSVNLVEQDEAGRPSGASVIHNAGEKRLLTGFRRLCLSNLYSDVTLLVGEEKLPAHKAALAAQSPVFESLFVSEARDVVNIGDLEGHVVKEMLHFIYSGSVEDLDGSAEALLVAADKYGLDDLKAMCEDSLGKNLTSENACQIFRSADLHAAPRLKAKSAEFMRRNMQAVQQTAGWKYLKQNSQTLLIEFFIEK